MNNGLVSSQTPNSQWKIHGALLLPNSFEEKTDEARNEPQETVVGTETAEESDEDADLPDEEDVAVAPPRPTVQPPSQPVTVVAPARPVQSAKPKDEVPQKWWFMLSGFLLFGILAIAVVNRPQIRGGGNLPNTSNPEQAPSPVPQQSARPGQPAQPIPALDLNAYEQARDQKFKDALEKARAAWGSCGQVCRARRDYYLSKAEEILTGTGTPMEVTLLRELNRQIGEQAKILPYNSELGGFSTEKVDQVGIARSLSGDALALLEALDHEWTRQRQAALGQPLPARTMTTVDLAPLSNDMATLWQFAALARNGKPQQALRDSVTFEPPAQPPKPETEAKKSESKQKPVGLPK